MSNREISRAVFCRRFTARREAAGLSQTALAEKVGVTVAQINNIERGVSWPSIQLHCKICAALGAGEVPMFERGV